MSRTVYLDCASGAAGDMLLGALVDVGLRMDALREELLKLPIGGYRLESRKVKRCGLAATKVDVVMTEPAGTPHEHGHPHGHEAAGHASRGHGHRGLSAILELIEASALAPEVKDRSEDLFRRLAEAEATVHGTEPETVHFHEVGAVDAIVDIVGGVLGLAWLRADLIVASPLNVGSGTVRMEHGVFSVPPPATALLVKGCPVYGDGEGELLTPTGALLVTGHAASYGYLPSMRVEAIGYGAGSRDTPGRPNVLRLIVGEERGGSANGRVLVLETEIDDMSGQLYGPLLDRLLAAGALDVYLTSVQMKKGRPGTLVTVLADPGRREAMEEVLFAESTTLGVRRQEWERTELERAVVPVETPYGIVAVKVGRRGDRVYNVQPEFEDCQRVSALGGVPVKEVWASALAAYRAASGGL